MISLLLFLPILAQLCITLVPIQRHALIKYITLGVTGLQLILSLYLYLQFDPSGGLQYIESYSWLMLDLGVFGKSSIDYTLGLNGINISMVLLSSIVLFVGALASWNIKEKTKGYHILYLLLCISIPGCFAAQDFFLFFIFFEFMLLPMYFLIGLWGGERREYASIKFLLYTLLGSLLILIVMIALHASVMDPLKSMQALGLTDLEQLRKGLNDGTYTAQDLVHTFNFYYLSEPQNIIPGSILSKGSGLTLFSMDPRNLAFIALMLGFLIKLPAIPFHTWLPDAHVEAPTPISVVLAGILLKIGGYGIIQIAFPMFPDMALDYAYAIGLLGVISILYGAFNALAMKDLKKLVAYSSVSHMGFVLLGAASLTAEGMSGAIYQLFSHGILSSLLFLLVGVLYDRTHDRGIENYRGLANKMPFYTTAATLVFFASFGLPGFSGFIAELFVLMGGFNSQVLPTWLTALATLGILLGAAYFLWTLQKMFFGRFWIKTGVTWKEGLYDLSTKEIVTILPLLILTFLFGILPSLLLVKITPGCLKWIELF